MSVNADRTGNTATITITLDVTDIIAAAGLSNADKRLRVLARAQGELSRAGDALSNPDATLDQRVTDLTATVAAVKAARPTGTL